MIVLDVWSYDSLADGRKTQLLVVRKILCLSDLMNVSPYDCIADGHKKILWLSDLLIFSNLMRCVTIITYGLLADGRQIKSYGCRTL